jgi:hypothetical protein
MARYQAGWTDIYMRAIKAKAFYGQHNFDANAD